MSSSGLTKADDDDDDDDDDDCSPPDALQSFSAPGAKDGLSAPHLKINYIITDLNKS